MTVRKYDYAGEKRIAMRENGVLYWLLTDHLGSTAVVADANGVKVGEVRYKAFGEDRYTFGTTPTTYRYTGQRQEAALGLYFYNARWYDPFLGRFVQADTLVPDTNSQAALTSLLVGAFEPDWISQVGAENREIAQYGFWPQRSANVQQQTRRPRGPANPMMLNRYTYANANPLRYTDPAGRYGHDVHYKLTYDWVYQIALEIGYEEAAAKTLATIIAEANEGQDHPGIRTAIDRTHWQTTEQAEALLQREVDVPVDLQEFGAALHALQDSYSHYKLGHRTNHIWPSLGSSLGLAHNPDEYGDNYGYDEEMAQASQEWVRKYLETYYSLVYTPIRERRQEETR